MSRTKLILDFLFCFIFAFLLIAQLLLDSQLVLPAAFYCEELQNGLKWYIETYKDPLFSDPPVWYLAFQKMQLVFYYPFYVVAIYAFARGRSWIRIPAIMFGASLLTALLPCMTYIQETDFYYHSGAAPHTDDERAVLIQQVYGPLMVFGIVLLVTMFIRKPVIVVDQKTTASNTQQQVEQNSPTAQQSNGGKKEN